MFDGLSTHIVGIRCRRRSSRSRGINHNSGGVLGIAGTVVTRKESEDEQDKYKDRDDEDSKLEVVHVMVTARDR